MLAIALSLLSLSGFVQIPHAKLIDQISYKCELAGIKVIQQEESYTSKTSALDLESPCKHETYMGRRVHRGLGHND